MFAPRDNSGMVHRLLCWSVLAAGAASAQPVKIYSEFQRVTPSGEVAAIDKAARPREILSPALVRGAWASLLIAVTPPDSKPFWIFIGQNPENAVKVAMYRPIFERAGDTWIPDRLEPLQLNEVGRVPDVPPQAPEQKTVVLWMDIWVAPDAEVRRTRLEVQLNSGEDWVIYPLELRILSPVAPQPTWPLERLARVDATASESAASVLRGYACGEAATVVEPAPFTIRTAIRRNARQDVALARTLEARAGRTALLADVTDAAGLGNTAAFCKGDLPQSDRGAEWYLKVRDLLYRLAAGPAFVPTGKPAITVHQSR